MSTVDNRVVEMQFDDADFTPGIKKAIDALGQLQQALKLDVPKNGMTALSSNTIAVSGAFEGLQYTVAKTANSFSTLEVAALMALNNIVNRAVDAGLRIAKSLTIDQVTQGFGEYELKMNSIQTIMAGTGEPLERVNELLDELNHYADKTIYSFSDMTANIGKFTNAGVKLDTAVDAIQGVSNLAALSGANASEASRAMYNFAQALSAGYVKLIDWKSIENANMATVEFKNQLLETALALGTVRKEGDMYVTTTTNATGSVSAAFDATHNFNDALSHQWMTTEVLTTTLAKYTDETTEIGRRASEAATEVRTWTILVAALKEAIGSGWARSYEILFGDYHQATEFWTGLSKAINSVVEPIGNFRNTILEAWATTERWGVSGREQLLNGFLLRFKTAATIASKAADAFAQSIGMDTIGQRLNDITARFYKDSIEAYRYITDVWVYGDMSKSVQGYIRYDLQGVYYNMLYIFNSIKRVVGGIVSAVGEVSKAFYQVFHDENGAHLVEFLNKIHVGIRGITLALVPTEDNLLDIFWASKNIFTSISNVFSGLVNIFGFINDLIAPIIEAFKEVMGLNQVLTKVTDPVRSLSEDFLAFTESLNVSQGLANDIKDTFKKVFQTIYDVVSAVVVVVSDFVYLVRTGGSVVDKKFSPILVALAKVVRTVITAIAGLVGGIALFISKLDFRKIADQFTKRIESIRDWISKLYEKFKANENISRFLELIQQAKDYISNLIETVKNTGSFEAFGNIIDDLSASFKNLQNETGFIGGAARALQSAIDMISGAVEYVKTKLEAIKKLFDELGITGGFEKMIQGIKGLDPSTFSEGFSEFGTGIYNLITEHIIPNIESGLQTAVGAVNTFLTSPDGLQSILNTVKTFFSIDKLTATFSDLGKNFDNTSLWNGATSLANGFVSGFLQIFGVPEEMAQDALTNFFWFMSGFADPLSHIVTIFSQQTAGAIGEAATILNTALMSLMDSMAAEVIDNPDEAFGKLLAVIQSMEVTALLGALINFVTNLSTLVGSLKGIPKALAQGLKGIGKAFKGLGRLFTGAAVLEIAISILVIAKAMDMLAGIDPDRMQQALDSILIIMAAIGAFILLLGMMQTNVKDFSKGDSPVTIFKDMAQGFSEGLKGLNIAGFGLAVAAIAGAVYILVLAVKQVADMLEKYDPEKLTAGAIAIAGMLAILVGIMKFVSGLNNGGAILGNGLAILALSVALKFIVSAISDLIPLMENDKFWWAFGAIAGMLVLLGGIMRAISDVTIINGKGGFGTFLGIGIAFILLAASLHVVVDAISKMLEIMNNPNFAFAAFVIGTFMAAMGLIIATIASALPSIQGGFGTFLGIGLAFILLAASLKIIVSAIEQMLPLIKDPNFLGAFKALAALMLIMAVSIAIIAFAAGQFKPKIGTLLGLGIAMVLMGVALGIVAQGISAIAEKAPSAELISTIVDKLGQLIIVMALILSLAGSMDTGFSGKALLFAVAMDAFAAAVLILSNAIANLTDVPADELDHILGVITAALVLFLVSAGIVSAIPPMEAALIILGTALLEAGEGVKRFGEGAVDIADAMIKIQHIKADAFDGVIDGLKKFLDTFSLWDAAKAKDLADGLSPLITVLGDLADITTKLKDAGLYSTAAALERLFNALDGYQGTGNLEEFSTFMEAVSKYQESMSTFSTYMDSSSNMVGKIGDSVPKLVEAEQSFIDKDSDFVAALDDVAAGLANFKDKTTGVSAIMADVSTAVGNLVAVMAGIIEKNADQVNPAGGALVDALAQGMEDESEVAQKSMENVVDNIRYGAESDMMATRYENAGKRLISQFMDGMEAQFGHVKDRGKDVANKAIEGMDDLYNRFLGIGKNAAAGFANGLGDSAWAATIYNRAFSMAQKAIEGAEDALQEKSPSRVFMQIGRYTSEGLAIGITGSEGLAEKAAFNMARAVSMVAQDSIDEINASKYDIYLNPVIDDAGLNSLSSGLMLNGMNFGMLGNTIAALNQNGSNGDLLAELQRVHRDLVEVASRPTTSIQMGDINTYDDNAMQDATKTYITKLAMLRGGMV